MQHHNNPHKNTPLHELEAGKVPTTAQTARMLDLAELKIEEAAQQTNISRTGKEVLEKAEDVLETGKRILVEKNPEEELQELYMNLRAGTSDYSGSAQQMTAQTKEKFESLSAETRQAISEVSSVTALFLRSPEFRMFVRELSTSWKELLEVIRGTAMESAQNVREVAQKQYRKMPSEVKSTDNMPQSSEHAKQVARESEAHARQGVEESSQRLQQVPEKLQSELTDRFNPERFDAILENLRLAVGKLRNRPEWEQAVNHLINIAYRMRARIASTLDTAASKAQSGATTEHTYEPDNQHLKMAQLNAAKIIEHLTNGKSIEGLVRQLDLLFTEMQNDPAVQSLFYRANDFVQKAISRTEFVQSPQFQEEGRALAEEARGIRSRPWMSYAENVSDEANEILDRIATDKLLNRFGRDWSDLMAAMFLDTRGNLTFKPELLTDTGKILKFVAERFNRLQINKIVHSDDEVDLVIDNLVLNVANVIPSQSRVRFTSRLDLEHSSVPTYLLELKFAKIQLDIETMRFWYSKKTFPKLTDTGYASATAGDDGLTLWIDISPAHDTKQHVFDVARVTATLPDLSFKVTDAKYSFLYKLLTPIAKGKIRKSIEDEIQKDINEFLMKLDVQFKGMRDATLSTITSEKRLPVEKDRNLPTWSSPAFDVELHREGGPKVVR